LFQHLDLCRWLYNRLLEELNKAKVEGAKLILSKVGAINIKLHRPIEGKIKGLFVKRELSGKWFAVFQCENKTVPLSMVDRAIGLDVGVTHFFV